MFYKSISESLLMVAKPTQLQVNRSLDLLAHVRLTCVPVVVAGVPGELRAEREHQVEQSPGQDNDVGHKAVDNDQYPTICDTCSMIDKNHGAFCLLIDLYIVQGSGNTTV